jgi:hypothetical protein
MTPQNKTNFLSELWYQILISIMKAFQSGISHTISYLPVLQMLVARLYTCDKAGYDSNLAV